AAKKLESIGAEGVLICADVMHKAASEVAAAVDVPISHIVNDIGSKLKANRIHKVGPLATRAVIESDFYRKPLEERFQVDVFAPEPEETEWVNYIIFEELGKGIVKEGSQEKLLKMIERLGQNGAEAYVLACPDLAPLLR
ncbi:hypothetical protein AOQ84DRAFT_271726, partial [Glonium stellatum]